MKKKIIDILYAYSNKGGYQSVGEDNFEQVADDIMMTHVMMDDKIPPRPQTSAENKAEHIFILMNLGKMTLTEINTLTRGEREALSKWFVDKQKQEIEYQKNKYR